jgi:hypothetical protein
LTSAALPPVICSRMLRLHAAMQEDAAAKIAALLER